MENVTETIIILLALTLILLCIAILRQKKRDWWNVRVTREICTIIHFVVMIFVIVPFCIDRFGTLVMSVLRKDFSSFFMGLWAIAVVLIIFHLCLEKVADIVGKLMRETKCFADSIDKIAAIESHLMNFLAVTGFYCSVVSTAISDKEKLVQNDLLFSSFVVFMDLVTLAVYKNVYLKPVKKSAVKSDKSNAGI